MRHWQKKRGVYLVITLPNIPDDKRILLAIGCDRYDIGQHLDSAEADAQNMFKVLVEGPTASYGSRSSMLLRSPTGAEIDAALRKLLRSHKHAGTVTFYFAGHGILSDGSFYLCPSDVSLGALSITGVNISRLLRAMCELRPRHAYVIIDACYSAGVALEISSVLRSELLERSPGFSLTILAASHLRKEAGETDAGGDLTAALLTVLTGLHKVQDHAPHLGLGEIVQNMPRSAALADQSPNLWGLNLSGPDIFASNPAFRPSTATDTGFGTLTHTSPNLPVNDAVLKNLWRTYLALPECEMREFDALFNQVAAGVSGSSEALVATTALVDSFATALQGNPDCFAAVNVRARMLRAILSQHGACDVGPAIRSHMDRLQTDLKAALQEVDGIISEYRYGLVGSGLISELYLLPLRITQLLGWIGFYLLADRLCTSDRSGAEMLRPITQKLLAHYGNSLVALGDDQAAPLLLFLTQCAELSWADEGEEVVGRLYHDFNRYYGRVLINDPSAPDIFNYLQLRISNPLEADVTYLQTPTDTFSVILIGAVLFRLDEAIDPTLIQLDRTSLAFYVPDSYKDFWQDDITEGETFILQLGHELQPSHGVWTVGDMSRVWRQIIHPRVAEAMGAMPSDQLLAAAACCLLQPDRLPWFTVPQIAPRTTTIRPL